MQSIKIKKRFNTKTAIVSLLVIIAVIALALATHAYTKKIGPFSESSYQNQSDKQLDSGNPAEPKGSVEELPVADNNKTPQEADQIDSTGNSSILEITSTQKLGDVVRIRTLIQRVTQQGECLLEITSGTRTYTASALVQPTANSSTCKGFDVPVESLPSGEWNIKVTYTNGGEMSVANSELQV